MYFSFRIQNARDTSLNIEFKWSDLHVWSCSFVIKTTAVDFPGLSTVIYIRQPPAIAGVAYGVVFLLKSVAYG